MGKHAAKKTKSLQISKTFPYKYIYIYIHELIFTVNLGFVGCALPSCSCFTSLVRISFGISVVVVTPGGKGILNLICE